MPMFRAIRLAVVLATLCVVAAAGMAKAASYTSHIGTPGGTPFEVSCPPGQVLVGIDYKSWDWLVAIAGFCKQVGADGKVTGKLYGTNGYGGDVTALTKPREPIYCRQDMVITKLAVAVGHDHLIRLIEVFCSPSTGSGQGFYVGTTKVDHQADGMVEYNRETEDCRFGVGFVGGASQSGPIQWLGLKCEQIAGPGPDKPPLEVDNGDNGNDGGGATAATDTTIYDQPEGNDVAYLSAGDPVTIVSCNAGNWCQISKPQQGWVWGEDLNR